MDETQILSLRGLTPPGFLVRTFTTGLTGCPSWRPIDYKVSTSDVIN